MSLKEYAADGGNTLAEAPDDSAPAAEQFAHLPLNVIVSSRTNPRKTFDQVKLRELAESIKASGVHQPILVRPLPGSRVGETTEPFISMQAAWPMPTQTKGPRATHEIVAGERRFRASLIAGVATIPAMVRRLTDDQVLEIQIVENLQRTDLSALEEAEGYERLMQHASITAEQVGDKIGKSKSFVYARLKLLDLFQTGREALREGRIDASKALLLARIPNEKLQGTALKEITKLDYQGDAMSEREAASHIQHSYMLQLSKARFKITDALLVPAAGSCRDCPKRTGFAPDLFTDVKGVDVCTDPTCFHQKEEAHAAVVVDQAKAKGQTVISGKEAQELMTSGYNVKFKGYRRLDVAEDSPTDQPLRKIIGAQMKAEGIEPVMIEHGQKKGELVAALPNEVVLKLLKTVEGQAQATKTVAKEVRAFADDKKAKAFAKAKAGYEQHWRDQLLARTFHRLQKNDKAVFGLNVHRHLAVRSVNSLSTDDATAIAQLLDLGKVGAHSALVEFAKDTINPDTLTLLMIMQRDSRANDHSYGDRVANAGLLLVAGNVFGDDLAIVTSEVQAESMAKYFPKAASTSAGRKKASAIDAPKDDLPHSPAAQATTTRGKGKGEKSKGLAAPDGARPTLKRKTTPQEAMEGIAEAMQGIGAPALAGAGSTDAEPAPGDAAGDTVPGSAAALQSNKAGPVADALAPAVDATAAAVALGRAVRVNECARSAIARPYVDRVGQVTRQAGPQAWFVEFAAKKGAMLEAGCSFHTSELDLVDVPQAADPLVQHALALVVAEQKASLRMLKAGLSIGQAKAAELLAALEADGKVSACDERGARKVLVQA